MKKENKILMAKSSPDGSDYWLPLWMHLRDTAGIMDKLVSEWISKSTFDAIDLSEKDFKNAAIFVAAIHDIGKSIAYFESIIARNYRGKIDELRDYGFTIKEKYCDKGRVPHSYAGASILLSEQFAVNDSIAMVVAAHHGKCDKPVSELSDLMKTYQTHFFGDDRKGIKPDVKIAWKNAWQDIVNQACELTGIDNVTKLPNLSLKAQVLISGLLIIADWLASNTTYFPLIPIDEYGNEEMYGQRIENAWNKIGFPDGWNSKISKIDDEIFKEKRFSFYPNEVQKSMMDAITDASNPGIFILEAQMGVGKTEAALAGAEILANKKGKNGIFFGLPTQATSNGIFKRVLEWGEKVSHEKVAIRLAHGCADLNEEYHNLEKEQVKDMTTLDGISYVDNIETDGSNLIEVHPWFKGNKKSLLADFVIGTVDQFLMSSLKRKHFMLRHIGLVGKVVIIDECHAYDAYMNQYLDRALEWMAAYKVPVILLSATLPSKRRKELVECYTNAYTMYNIIDDIEIDYPGNDWENNESYPLLTWSDGNKIRQKVIDQNTLQKTIHIENVDSIDKMIGIIDSRLKDGGCASIIVNTVKCAQEICEKFNQAIKNKKIEKMDLLLYHAHFTMIDRVKKEKELLKRIGKDSTNEQRNRFILIGTQVLEQSLDYDADIMVTQLCPMDLLLQRMGRLHRHENRNSTRPKAVKEPYCIILRDGENAYDSGTKSIYGDYLLMRTDKILPNDITIPQNISNLVQKVYNKDNDLSLSGKEYESALMNYEDCIKDKKYRADDYKLDNPYYVEALYELFNNINHLKEKYAECSVRDSTCSIEVLLMKRNKNCEIQFVNGKENITLSTNDIPESEIAKKIAMQKLKLPHVFSKEWNIENTIDELEEQNKQQLAIWQQSPWLKGELILLLDENNEMELNGYKVFYSLEKGFEYEKKEEAYEGEGI